MTFLCGRAGVCALGAVAAKHAGDERLLDHYVTRFKEVVAFIKFPILMILFLSKLIAICFNCSHNIGRSSDIPLYHMSRLDCLVIFQMNYYMEELGSYGPRHS